MAVFVKTYYGKPGFNFISDSELAYVKVLRVAKEDLVLSPKSTMPTAGSMDFYHDSAAGKVYFGNEFTATHSTGRPKLSDYQRVLIEYKA